MMMFTTTMLKGSLVMTKKSVGTAINRTIREARPSGDVVPSCYLISQTGR